MGFSQEEVISLVGAGVFALAGGIMLVSAWRFMMKFYGYRRHKKGGNNELRSLYGRNDYSDTDDDDGRKKKKGKKQKKASSKKAGNKEYDGVVFRDFHHSMLSYVFGTASIAFAIFYLLQWTGVLYLTRASDGVTINPFRWLFMAPIAASVSGLLASMFVNHYIMDLMMIQLYGNAGRLILGLAMFLPVKGGPFWALFATALVLLVIAFLFLFGRNTLRSSRSIALFFYAIINAAYVLTYLGSPEELNWFSSLSVTLILYLILDALSVILPYVVVLTDWYFKYYGIPVLPLMIYDAYGLGHWWKMHTNNELHYLWPKSLLMVKPAILGKHHHHKDHTDDGQIDDTLGVMSKCNLCGIKERAEPDPVSKTTTTTGNSSQDANKKKGRKNPRVDIESSNNSESSDSESSGSDSGYKPMPNTEAIPNV